MDLCTMRRLRVSVDFNSCCGEDCWWNIHYNGRSIKDQVEELGLYDGMPVVAFYKDPGEEFEYDGILRLLQVGPPPAQRWVVVVDRSTYRLIRETPIEELRGFGPKL
jgi:hypothetical protein